MVCESELYSVEKSTMHMIYDEGVLSLFRIVPKMHDFRDRNLWCLVSDQSYGLAYCFWPSFRRLFDLNKNVRADLEDGGGEMLGNNRAIGRIIERCRTLVLPRPKTVCYALAVFLCDDGVAWCFGAR